MIILHLQRVEINIKGPSVPNSSHQSSSSRHPARTPNIDHNEPHQPPNSPPPNPSPNPHNPSQTKQTQQPKNLFNNTVKNKHQTTNYIRATSSTTFNNTNKRISRTTTRNTTKDYAGIHDRPRDAVSASHTTTAQPPDPIVETVCEDDKTPTSKEYDPMADAPDPVTPTPSYVPLHRKNKHWGDPCEPSTACVGPDFIRIYGINCNGISNSTGLKYDKAFELIKETEAGIFAFNETHADEMNVLNNSALNKSRRRMFNQKEKDHVRLIASSSSQRGSTIRSQGGI